MPENPLLPNIEEQLQMQRLLVEYGDQGYGLCFLFGASRAQGLSCEDAIVRIQHEMAARTGGKECVPGRSSHFCWRCWSSWPVPCSAVSMRNPRRRPCRLRQK